MADDFSFLDALADPALRGGCVLTIGNFDGVHLGHRALIGQVVTEARALGVAAAALTFEPHPKSVFRGVPPETFRLTSAAERSALMLGAGLDAVVTATFQPEFAELSPEHFVSELLVGRLHARRVHVGYDFNFGKGRAGTTATLGELTAQHGVTTTVHPAVADAEEPYSSTRVRGALRGGDMATVTRLLGRPFRLAGTTAAGAGRGKGMGIPTLNLYPAGRLLPPHGVYACRLWHDGKRYDAIANLGRRPTFEDDDRVSFETLSLDPFEVEGRGLEIAVDLIAFVRPERAFDSPDALKAQIGVDVQTARDALRAFDEAAPR